MAESRRKSLIEKRKELLSHTHSDKYMSLIGTIATLAVTFIIGFSIGFLMGKWL